MYRTPDNPAGQGSAPHPSFGKLRTASSTTGRPGARQAQCAESARLGIRCHGRPMQPATLRVLETTWRVWREPLA